MNKPLPDKWIRKAFFEACNGMAVDGLTIPVYDYRVTGDDAPANYVLMTTQSNQVNKLSQCGYVWESDLLVEVFTTYSPTGDTGSRLLSDNILNEVRERVQDLQLDPASSMKVDIRTFQFPNDLSTITQTKIVFRKFIRILLTID